MTHIQPRQDIAMMIDGQRYRRHPRSAGPYRVDPVGEAATICDVHGINCLSTDHGQTLFAPDLADRLCEVLNKS